MFTLKLTPIWMFIILISVLILASIFGSNGSMIEGFDKTSQILNMHVDYVTKALDSYNRPVPPGAPPGVKELMDKTKPHLEYFKTETSKLVSELATTTDTDVASDSAIEAELKVLKKKIEDLQATLPKPAPGTGH